MFWLIRFALACFLAYAAYFGMFKSKGLNRALGCGCLGLAFIVSPGGSEPLIGVLMGLGVIVIAVIWALVYSANEKNGINQKKREAEQEQIKREYEVAVESQFAEEPWIVRYATSPCPHCGHYKVRYAEWEDKRYSVAFWGAASDKLGKNYKCEHCGEMW